MNDPEHERQRRLLSLGGCSCFINPPCGFCTELTEDELEVYLAGGLGALVDLFNDSSNGNEPTVNNETV